MGGWVGGWLSTFDHGVEGVAEPVGEFLAGAEDVGHEEVHEGPELHEVVLEGGTWRRWVGGWVGWEKEEEAVAMRC